jgi:hypothetical protein
MSNWRVIGQIAAGFGIIFIVFAALEAFVNYQAITIQQGFIPAGYLQVYVLNAMLPFLLFAVLSFVVAAVTMRSGKDYVEKAPAEIQPAEIQSTEPEV